MKNVIFIDDCKRPENYGLSEDSEDLNLKVARSYFDALSILTESPVFNTMYLDWDLCDRCGDGHDILNWLADNPKYIPEEIIAISMSPDDNKLMRQKANTLMIMRKRLQKDVERAEVTWGKTYVDSKVVDLIQTVKRTVQERITHFVGESDE